MLSNVSTIPPVTTGITGPTLPSTVPPSAGTTPPPGTSPAKPGTTAPASTMPAGMPEANLLLHSRRTHLHNDMHSFFQ